MRILGIVRVLPKVQSQLEGAHLYSAVPRRSWLGQEDVATLRNTDLLRGRGRAGRWSHTPAGSVSAQPKLCYPRRLERCREIAQDVATNPIQRRLPEGEENLDVFGSGMQIPEAAWLRTGRMKFIFLPDRSSDTPKKARLASSLPCLETQQRKQTHGSRRK